MELNDPRSDFCDFGNDFYDLTWITLILVVIFVIWWIFAIVVSDFDGLAWIFMICVMNFGDFV